MNRLLSETFEVFATGCILFPTFNALFESANLTPGHDGRKFQVG